MAGLRVRGQSYDHRNGREAAGQMNLFFLHRLLFFSGGMAFLVSCAIGMWATWLIQKELNIFATG